MKFSKEKREELKQYILDCYIMRYSLPQTIQFIEAKCGVKICESMISKFRTQLKRDSQKEFANLRNDQFEYHYQFLQRIQEVRKCQQIQWELYEKSNSEVVRHNCIKEYHALTISLANLYLDMPHISDIRPNRTNGELQEKIQEQSSSSSSNWIKDTIPRTTANSDI
jgi:hypothetical protein